jgi:hypothetical protein
VYGSVFECQFVGLDGVVVKRSLLVGARAPAVLWGEVAPAVRLLWGRVAPTAVPLAVAVALVPMVAVTVWLAATSAHVEHPTATALYWSYFVAAHVLIGLYWWLRRPASRFGPLLVALGIVAWVVSWESSQWPLAFDLGVLAEGPGAFLTFYLLLAFPTGRLDSVALRWLMLALAVAIAGFFLPWALFTPVLAGGGVLSRCVPACPENVLQIGSAPQLVEVAGKAETYSLLAITVAVLAVYAVRLRAASRPRRRALLAVAVTSLLFLPVFFAFHFSRLVLEVAPQTLDVLQWALVGARILFPLGFLVALVQADAFAATASRRLLERLVTRPTPARWHALVARTLDDPALRLGFWDPPSREFRGPDGIEVTPPAWDSGRAWVPVERDGHPVAAMDIDEAWRPTPNSFARRRRPPSWRLRTASSRASCAHQPLASSRPDRPSAGCLSATCTTVPNSGSWHCGSTSASPASGSINQTSARCSSNSAPRSRRPSTSSAAWRTGSTRSSWSSTASQRRCGRRANTRGYRSPSMIRDSHGTHRRLSSPSTSAAWKPSKTSRNTPAPGRPRRFDSARTTAAFASRSRTTDRASTPPPSSTVPG